MKINAGLKVTGSLSVVPLRKLPSEVTLKTIIEHGLPHFRGLPWPVFFWRLRNLRNMLVGMWKMFTARRLKIPHFVGAVWGDVLRKDGRIERLGLLGVQIVTTAGVNYIASRMANSSPANISLFNFHGLGTGTNAAAITDTALQTELTTQYNPDSTRATGAQSNPSANIYQSLGTNTLDGAAAVTEWGLLTQAATGGGTLLDRIVFAVVNLASGDSLQTTFQFTISAGG